MENGNGYPVDKTKVTIMPVNSLSASLLISVIIKKVLSAAACNTAQKVSLQESKLQGSATPSPINMHVLEWVEPSLVCRMLMALKTVNGKQMLPVLSHFFSSHVSFIIYQVSLDPQFRGLDPIWCLYRVTFIPQKANRSRSCLEYNKSQFRGAGPSPLAHFVIIHWRILENECIRDWIVSANTPNIIGFDLTNPMVNEEKGSLQQYIEPKYAYPWTAWMLFITQIGNESQR